MDWTRVFECCFDGKHFGVVFLEARTWLLCIRFFPDKSAQSLVEGIKRLRAVHAGERTSLRLWRGLRNVRGEFLARTGGTERAPLSCTPHLETAARFATSREAFLLLITVKSFMQGGAALEFLSCVPHEREVCYPPCNYLKPTGRSQRVDLPGELRCVVVEVTPHVGS